MTKKRAPKKLSLSKKSVRRIDPAQLDRVAGGITVGTLCDRVGNGLSPPIVFTNDCTIVSIKPGHTSAANHNQHLAVRR